MAWRVFHEGDPVDVQCRHQPWQRLDPFAGGLQSGYGDGKAETELVGPLTALHAMQAAALAAAGPFHSWHTVKRRQ